MEIVGIGAVGSNLQGSDAISSNFGHLRQLAGQIAVKDALVSWIRANNPPTLGKLLVEDKVVPGQAFTLFTNYYCRGLSKVSDALEKGKSPVPHAEAYAKLDDLRSGWRVSFRFHHEHLTSNSSWSELSG